MLTNTYDSSVDVKDMLPIQIFFCFLFQGPRGLPGERGRPGPSGAAVSMSVACIFQVYLQTILLGFWNYCRIIISTHACSGTSPPIHPNLSCFLE